MRAIGAGIGLLSLLMGVALMMYLFAQSEIPKAREGKKLQAQAQQISGRGTDGESAMDSFATQPLFKGSKLDGLSVTGVTSGGAMDSYYGLKPGDAITSINDLKLNDVSNGDDQLAKSLVAEAFSKQQTLTVRRGSLTITLPAAPGTIAAAAAAGSPGAPAAPGAAPADPAAPAAAAPAPAKPRGLQEQLQDIQNAAGK